MKNAQLCYKPDVVIEMQGDRYGICLPPKHIMESFEKELGGLPGVLFGDTPYHEGKRATYWEEFCYSEKAGEITGSLFCGDDWVWERHVNVLSTKISKGRLTTKECGSVEAGELLDKRAIHWRPMLIPLTSDNRFDASMKMEHENGEIVKGGSISVNAVTEEPGKAYTEHRFFRQKPLFSDSEEENALEWMWMGGVLISIPVLAFVNPQDLFQWGYAVSEFYPYFGEEIF